MNVKHKKKADVICWSTVEFNLIEAVNELEDLLVRVSDQVRRNNGDNESRVFDRELSQCEFAIQLAHAYHHLNSAWNARMRAMPDADRTYHRNELWPRASYFKRFWPNKI